MKSTWFTLIAATVLFGATVATSAATIEVVMENMAISPAQTPARIGDTVMWINKDVFAHTATARNGDWDVTIQPKQTGTVVLKKVGTVDYFCRFHPNMKATMTVGP